MARAVLRKAAKAYPQFGIEKGDSYYFAQIKTGPRSSRTIRSKNPIPRSQLTTSSFKSSLYDIEDNGFSGIESADDLREVAERIRELGQEAQDSLDNMPEGLQQGSTGELLQERIDGMDSWADEIDSAADELETELQEFNDQVEAYKTYLEEMDEYDTALSNYEDLSEEEQANEEEPVEPDEPDLPDGIDSSDINNEDVVAAFRQEVIDNRVTEAQDANPGVE